MQVGGFVNPNIANATVAVWTDGTCATACIYSSSTPTSFVPAQQAATPVMAAPEVLPTFEQLMPAPEGRYDELVEFENKDTGQKMTIPFVNGEPIYPIPQGFTRVETDIVEPTPEPEVVPTARVESAVDDGGDDEMRRAEEEAMFGRGGRVSLGGELYTGPTRFVGDNVKTRQISGTVQGATKVGVSFDVPGGFSGLKSTAGLAAGLAFGKGINDNATATFFLNGQTTTVTAEEYNRIKENKFRGVEAENIVQELQQRAEYNQAQKDERVSKSQRNREKLDKRLEAAQKTGKENAIRKAELDVLKNEAAKFGLDTKNFNIDNMQELKDKISEETYRQAEINRQRKESQNTYHQYESDKGESRNEYSFSDYSDNVASGTEDRGYGAAYDEDVLGLAD